MVDFKNISPLQPYRMDKSLFSFYLGTRLHDLTADEFSILLRQTAVIFGWKPEYLPVNIPNFPAKDFFKSVIMNIIGHHLIKDYEAAIKMLLNKEIEYDERVFGTVGVQWFSGLMKAYERKKGNFSRHLLRGNFSIDNYEILQEYCYRHNIPYSRIDPHSKAIQKVLQPKKQSNLLLTN